ncbi:hypothetical protein [Hahella ganghwensis]|uniref:hypothetical protein n=1 Tax=Hahella ganghwensis TaxID=286420 RepID=UPI000374A026|nr:hypothetical protein [Hahella ganghwensis]
MAFKVFAGVSIVAWILLFGSFLIFDKYVDLQATVWLVICVLFGLYGLVRLFSTKFQEKLGQ